MENNFNILNLTWINQPQSYCLTNNTITITTEPETDLWQKTYYGFINDNAPMATLRLENDFTFSVKTSFIPQKTYDQCGIILYQNSENWFKASIEYENKTFSRLGSVLTSFGYSDWASVDIPTKITTDPLWYRLSKRERDFLCETSENGEDFKQMRLFHLHEATQPTVNIGLYACSPLESTFQAEFSNFRLSESIWKPYKTSEK